MDRRRIAYRVSLLLIVVGAIGWLAWGSPAFGFACLFGILGLTLTFIFTGGPAGMYGHVPETVRAGDERGQPVPRSSKTMAGPY
jgi:uncharacterized membrane protein YuzA (DUF378 family)